MRRILVDHARARKSEKRGGEAGLDAADLVALHSAIEKLEKLDPRQARVVALRVFGGLSVEETARGSVAVGA